MLSAQVIEEYIQFAKSYEESVDKDTTVDPTITPTSYTPDPHSVSNSEAQSYYAGLHSEPTLLYRTGKEQWSPPSGPEAQRRLKELCQVFTHPITKVWNHDLAWKVVDVMDAHTVSYNIPSYRRVC